jgi:hypothetical protein
MLPTASRPSDLRNGEIECTIISNNLPIAPCTSPNRAVPESPPTNNGAVAGLLIDRPITQSPRLVYTQYMYSVYHIYYYCLSYFTSLHNSPPPILGCDCIVLFLFCRLCLSRSCKLHSCDQVLVSLMRLMAAEKRKLSYGNGL